MDTFPNDWLCIIEWVWLVMNEMQFYKGFNQPFNLTKLVAQAGFFQYEIQLNSVHCKTLSSCKVKVLGLHTHPL